MKPRDYALIMQFISILFLAWMSMCLYGMALDMEYLADTVLGMEETTFPYERGEHE